MGAVEIQGLRESYGALEQSVFLDDKLERDGCARCAECRYIVGQFRLGTARYRRMARVFIATTPAEFLALAPETVAARRFAMAVLDLDEYTDFDAVMEAAKDTSEKRGRANREYARAQRQGYYVKPFAYAQFIPDLFDIHHSKTVRQGRELRGDLYFKTVAQMGGAPTAPVAIETPACPQHHWQYWGVFRRVAGYRQGEVQTDEQLVAYIRLRRQGDSSAYTLIMGHGEHLRHGIMYLLHYEIVAHMLRQPAAARPRYLVYQNYVTSGAEGIDVWKHRALFKPRYLHYVEDRPVSLPCEPPMPNLGEGLLALKSSILQPWPVAMRIAKEFGVSLRWLKSLHQAWVIESAHAPQLTARILRAGPNPPLDVLRPLASGLFPVDLIDPAWAVTVILHGATRGLDCLAQIHDSGARDVTVCHPDEKAVETLQALYGDTWRFKAWTADTQIPRDGVLIVEGPSEGGVDFVSRRLEPLTASFSGLLIVSLDEQVMAHFGYDAHAVNALYGLYGHDPEAPRLLCDQFSCLLARQVSFAGAFYRHGEPETFWIAFRLE